MSYELGAVNDLRMLFEFEFSSLTAPLFLLLSLLKF